MSALGYLFAVPVLSEDSSRAKRTQMNKFHFVAGSLLVMSFLPGGFVQAQDVVCDSLRHDIPLRISPDDTHRFTLREVLIPTAIVGASAVFTGGGWGYKAREKVQEGISPRAGHKTKVDDYLQYSQMVAVYGLNLAGVKGKHSLKETTILLAMSYATMGILTNGMKYVVKERRPDSGSRNSFPSGHTATAFMGAEFLYKEYKDVSPWIGYAGYAVAAATGYLRIYNNRHYLNDVIAGACIGILSTKFAYWLYPRIFKRSRCGGKKRVAAMGMPYYSGEGAGMSMCMFF